MLKSASFAPRWRLCYCLCKYMFLMFLADDGCGRKRKTGAGSKSEDCMNPDSSVMTAFKGETVTCCVPGEPVLYMYSVFILWQHSSKNSTPSTINTSVWSKSVEISPSRANGPYSSCTESPGQIHHLIYLSTVICLFLIIWVIKKKTFSSQLKEKHFLIK